MYNLKEEQLKNGWLIELNNQASINKGEATKLKAIKVSFNKHFNEYIMTYHGDFPEAQHGYFYSNKEFDLINYFVKTISHAHDLKIRKMTRMQSKEIASLN